MATTYINVNGSRLDASLVDTPGREFRSAWVYDGSAITVDIEKAREIKLEKRLEHIAQRLIKLEKRAQMRSLRGKDTTDIDARIEALRGRAARANDILNATTVAELEAIDDGNDDDLD